MFALKTKLGKRDSNEEKRWTEGMAAGTNVRKNQKQISDQLIRQIKMEKIGEKSGGCGKRNHLEMKRSKSLKPQFLNVDNEENIFRVLSDVWHSNCFQ